LRGGEGPQFKKNDPRHQMAVPVLQTPASFWLPYCTLQSSSLQQPTAISTWTETHILKASQYPAVHLCLWTVLFLDTSTLCKLLVIAKRNQTIPCNYVFTCLFVCLLVNRDRLYRRLYMVMYVYNFWILVAFDIHIILCVVHSVLVLYLIWRFAFLTL